MQSKLFKDNILRDTITLDPGDHSGWAYWMGTLYPETGQFTTTMTAKNPLIEDTLVRQWLSFEILLTKYKPRYFFVEGVEFWEGSFKSMTAAKRKNLFKLSYLVGGYCREAVRRGVATRILPASEWKGQTNNDVLERKLYSINGILYPTEHILNAVGIGMSRMGLLQDTKNQPGKWKKIRSDRWENIKSN